MTTAWPRTLPASNGYEIVRRHCNCQYSHVSGLPRFLRRKMPPPTNTPKAMLTTINVGAMAMVEKIQDNGAPVSRPAAPDEPHHLHSSSAVKPRTTTGWRFRRCGRNDTVASPRLSWCPQLVCVLTHLTTLATGT